VESFSEEAEDSDIILKLPQVVIDKFLELHSFVANKEKHRRLRKALLETAREIEEAEQRTSKVQPSTSDPVGLSEDERHRRYAKVHQEILHATGRQEVGLFTRQLVRGIERHDVHDVILHDDDQLSSKVAIFHRMEPEVIRTPSNPDGLDPVAKSFLVKQLTCEVVCIVYEL
jgi:hypothetical protein